MVTDTSPQQGYDRKFFEDIRLIDVDPSGGATWEMDVTEYWSNLNGTTIRIKCTTLQHGRTMAMLRGVIESVDGKIVYATAEHHKVATPAKPEFAERLMKEREKVALRRTEKL
ncbi:hypothetical protein MaudCBS49596_001596 [Microsporum audouinii]